MRPKSDNNSLGVKKELSKIEFENQKIYELEKSILRIENRILAIQELLEKEFDLQQERNIYFRHGISGILEHFKDQLSKSKTDVRHKLFELYRNNSKLGYPHEKILKVLINKYDGHVFGFLNVNKIVKEARIGKNKSADYLALLEDFGYVVSRRIGRKHIYKINVRILEKEIKKPAPIKEKELEASEILQQDENR